MIVVESRRQKMETLERLYPGAFVVDLTSKGPEPWVRFSPFFPHGGIPVPFSPGCTAQSVEGIWQGLKVFEGAGVDERKFHVTSMKGLKRTVRKFGLPRGHQRGLGCSDLLDYISARKEIYLPVYQWVLENRLGSECGQLAALARQGTLVLLDYETNADVDDPRKPLSHASLVKRYLEAGG